MLAGSVTNKGIFITGKSSIFWLQNTTNQLSQEWSLILVTLSGISDQWKMVMSFNCNSQGIVSHFLPSLCSPSINQVFLPSKHFSPHFTSTSEWFFKIIIVMQISNCAFVLMWPHGEHSQYYFGGESRDSHTNQNLYFIFW